jgi:1,2-diacylglycerol 3-alpha-glucosyltransferase
MKIVMVCDFYDDRLEYQENLLAKYYAKRGIDVTVIAPPASSIFDYVDDRGEGGGDHRVEQTHSAKVLRIPYRYNILNRIRVFPDLTALFVAESPDIIFFHDIIPNIVGAARYVRTNPDCTLIMDYHADYSNSGDGWASKAVLHGVVRKAMLDRARPAIARIFPIVPGSADFLRDIYRVPDAEMALLPLGCDLDVARAVRASSAGSRVRDTLGIATDAFVIFTGGKFHPLKQTEDLIRAVHHVDRPDVHLIVAGDAGPGDADYKAKLIAAAQGNPAIHFVGWQDSGGMYRHMAAADMAVFPASQSVLWQQSIGMGLPLAVSEWTFTARGRQDVSYMNRGNIIVMDRAANLEPQIAGVIRALFDDRTRLSAMAEAADQVAGDMLDYAVIVDRTLAVCQAV